MDEQSIQQIAEQLGPQVIRQTVDQVLSEIQPGELTADQLRPLIAALEETLTDPRVYPQAVRALIESGVADPEDLPPQFDAAFVVLMVIVLNKVAEALQQRETATPVNFKHGGLTDIARALQSQGRHGDTMLVHINPAEAAMLKRMGGSGTINPRTGLPEFWNPLKSVKSAFKSVGNAVKGVVKELGPIAPIIAAVAAPYAIPWLAGTIGVGSLAAGAIYGATTSALTGGNPIQGAVMGALGGGMGDWVGGQAAEMLGTSLSPATQTLVGNTLVGGALGAATGQGFGKGAMGALGGTLLGNAVGNLAGQGTGTPVGQGLTQAGQTIGQMTTAGMPLKQAVIGGALSGLVKGTLAANASPLDKASAVTKDIDAQVERVNRLLADPTVPETAKQAYSDYLNQLMTSKESMLGTEQTLSTAKPGTPEYTQAADLINKPGTGAYSGTQGIYQNLGIAPPPEASLGGIKLGFNMPTALTAGALALPLAADSLAKMQTPNQIQDAVKSTNPEYFENLRLKSWDWNDIQQKAAASNMPLGLYVAQNWGDLANSVRYTSPVTATEPEKKARGGALSKIAYLAQGSGSGRADTIDARLSDGEYVIDAETVALLGDGSTRAGAQKLDEMRSKVRQHKGRALSRGKFSPNAKSPLAYLKGAA